MYERRTAVVDGLRISYITAGEGIPIIFIHGLGGRAEAWLHQLKTLSNGFKVLALDLRGFGRSETPPTTPTLVDFARDVLGVMEWEGLDRAIVAGSSMGGMVAMRLYETAGSRVLTLILSNTAPRIRVNVELLERALVMGDAHSIERVSERQGGARLPNIISGSPHYILRVARSIQAEDLTHIPPRIRSPTLLIAGERDKITPPEVMRKMQSEIPGSILHIVPGAGHLTHIEKPREYTSILLEFLHSIRGRQSQGTRH